MQKRNRIIGIALLAIAGVIGYASAQRPVTIVTTLHTPDEKHIHQVFDGNNLGERLPAPGNSIDGIRFWLADDMKTPDTAAITLHVRKAGTDTDIRTVAGTLAQFRSQTQLEYYDDTYSLVSSANTLYFPFERIADSNNQTYDFVLTADVPPRQALRIRYESDEKKFPAGSSFSSEGAEQGNLGFILYERPTIATLAVRWLRDTQHILIWPAFGLILFGALWWPKQKTIMPKSYGLRWDAKPWLNHMLWIAVGLFLAGVVMYWPATHLFYYHDDLALLARVKHFQELGTPWKILTAHDYLETDPYSKFGFYFWRPVSALYTWATYAAIGLHPTIAYGINLILLSLTAGGLFFVAYTVLRSKMAAAIASLAWLAHSTKIGAIYWWSESQDIVAGLFAIFSILLFVAWRQAPKKRSLLRWSLGLFAIGALAKEHVFLLPLVLLVISASENRWTIRHLRSSVRLIAPFLLIAGLALAARTIALGDPTLPYVRRIDDTYAFTTSPVQVAKNITTYAAWSAEHWLWPRWNPFDSTFGNWLDQLRLQPPLYPGLVLLMAYAFAWAFWGKHAKVRRLLLISGAWWILLLAPQLLLAHDWRFRWLYLPIFGIALLIGFTTTYIPPKYRTNIGMGILAVLAAYGFWQARLPNRTRFYREQSAYIEEATAQYEAQKSHVTADSTMYLIGVAEQETTSLNAYLFRLLDPYYPFYIVRQEELPSDPAPSAIVIDMRGIDAYYPEHER